MMSNASIVLQTKEFYKMLSRELKSGQLSLPPFPEIAFRVRNVLEDPNTDLEDIVKVLKLDPALSARVLQLANTASMAASTDNPIIDLKSAISRVGLKVVRNAAMSLAMQQIYQSSTTSAAVKECLDSLWDHSVDVASLSYVLAKKCSKINPDEALLAGLLHDVGKLLIIDRAEFYPEIMSDPVTMNNLLNKWSPKISSSIVSSWGLGDELAQVARNHVKLDRDPGLNPDLTDIVMMSNLISLKRDINLNKTIEYSQASALKRLHMTAEQFTDIVEEIQVDAKLLGLSLLE